MADKEVIDRIARVDPVTADTMRDSPTTLSWQALPFYRKFKLLRASVTLPHRALEFHFADDGTRIVVLRSYPKNIDEVNAAESLHLEAGQIPSYVRFYFDNISGQRFLIVERSEDVPWLKNAGGEAALKQGKDRALSLVQPLAPKEVSPNSHSVLATAVRDIRLFELDLLINADGHVQVKGERVVLENLPVTQTLP